ncbi:MAG: hypothetical protein DI628_08310 [Blastochloris viridis]|uniref:Uncharacterized protein n=1 Tax=Blastochloris viridis TaxID=1079 RepID=A0A6N4RB40_BLAVI|nr:MAG: hypothetical protein DI628_08310 [Blastochloris viridis]
MTPLLAGSLTFLSSFVIVTLACRFRLALLVPLYHLERAVTHVLPDLADSYLRLIIPAMLAWLTTLIGILLLYDLLQPPLSPYLFVGLAFAGAITGALISWLKA